MNKIFDVKLSFVILESDAWKKCGSKSRDIYVGLLSKYNGFNNGEILYSVREAASYAKCSKNTAGLAFRKLEKVGLIRCVNLSSFVTKKKARKWFISFNV
tara:strand:+ start:431 stop:730 length:300 start_codon:yes stop_codon:yes gene_type:complete